jgi:hypothetical protein
MAETIASKIFQPVIAMLCTCIIFIRSYMAALAWFETLSLTPFFTCAYARRRIATRTNHERKFALFTGCTEQGCLKDINYRIITFC